MAKFVTVIVIILFGVMLADMVANPGGTNAFFNGVGGLWATSTNAMLGHPTTVTKSTF